MRSIPLLGSALDVTLRTSVQVGRYLGAYAVVSFAIAISAAIVLAELAEQLGLNAAMVRFDIALSHSLSQHLPRTLLATCGVLTHFGDAAVLTVIVIGVAMLLFGRRRYVFAWAWLATTAGGGIMTRLLKLWFARTRPIYEHDFTTVHGWSFPSGHASGSLLVYGLIGYLLVRHSERRAHVPIVIATMILVVFVGSSRVLLQVHYFSDVVAGWATAILWLSLCIAGLETVRRRAALLTMPAAQ
jgi:undecaprenyl-diphosphatase